MRDATGRVHKLAAVFRETRVFPARCMLSRFLGNWFQPHYRNIYTTFRSVER